eukprot:5497534-Pyramimonas_sp.AAC.1
MPNHLSSSMARKVFVRVRLRMLLRASTEVARWPWARTRRSAPSAQRLTLAMSLLKAPSPSGDHILAGPCCYQIWRLAPWVA